MKQNNIHIGTSGFSYKDWLGNFYPQFCPQADFLQFYTSKFKTVEIDSTFYRIPAETTIDRWDKVTSDDFIFAAKFPRSVTHESDISNRLAVIKQFVGSMELLGDKLGPLLMQFPYSFKPDQKDVLFKLFDGLPNKGRFAIELRNKLWLKHDDLIERMKQQNLALCLIDHPWMPRLNLATADFAYFRFLGDRKKIECDFSFVRNDRSDELNYWSELVLDFAAKDIDCYGYFNNHYSGHSPSTARAFQALLK